MTITKTDRKMRPWQVIYDQLGIQPLAFDDRPMAAHIARHAAERGDRPALQYFDRLIDFSTYDRLASQLANALTALGVSRGDVVGLHMPNIPQYPIALAAISRLGAIGTGLSPLLSPPELADQIADSGARTVIALGDLLPAYAALGPALGDSLDTIVATGAAEMLGLPPGPLAAVEGIPVQRWQDVMDGQAETCAQAEVGPDDVFMIQYTGGTTGKPKGAELTVRNLMHNVAQYTAADPIEIGREVTTSAFPFFHVAGLSQCLFGAEAGGCLAVVPDPRNTAQICALMTAMPPTRIAAVPALYDMLLADPAFAACDFSGLKTAVTGAAPITTATSDALDATIGAGKLVDVFGMTETSPCYLFHPRQARRPGAVGIPVPGADVRIVDVETGTQTLPAGEPGEIICAGPQVMKGYLGLPEETAHALRRIDGERWMFSGDVGYMDEGGYVFLCDRAKDMLVVGGYKVFSVEVEDKLAALDTIAASAIVGAPDTARPGNDVVHLFVQPVDPDADPEVMKQDILAFCRANMAPYKVPRDIHLIAAIPLTPVGKIDKKLLRARLTGQS